jgi:hypothetical protein
MSELIDNSAQRLTTLKGVILGLHAGEDPAAVKARLAALLRTTGHEELVVMEQQLLAEGMPIDEIKVMCDLHAEVTRDLMMEKESPALPAGHPVQVMQAENLEIAKRTTAMRSLLRRLARLDPEDAPGLAALLDSWRAAQEELLETEKHYARKENLLFPFLEQHGISGPSQVMWAKDDEIRALLGSLRGALLEREAAVADWQAVAEHVALPLLEQIEGMIYKEEKILLPMALDKLTPEQWGAIHRESPRFGYCLVEPGRDYQAPAPPAEPGLESAEALPAGASINMGHGRLTQGQLEAVMRTLPVDLTFVDAADRVAFFSEGPTRIFQRTPAIIGRKVQNCHPPASVGVVQKILDDFRAGRQDLAEFWIPFQGMFVHIRYFAVRDAAGAYLGTLEVTQDIAPLKSLEGERRLLEYDA